MLSNSAYDGTLASIIDVADTGMKQGVDKGDYTTWPLMLRVVLRTVMIVTGTSGLAMLAAVRQAYDAEK